MAFEIRARQHLSTGEQPFEVVERKGIGHPDTICDGVAEQISRSLCRYYLEHFGRVLHHNVDKVLLVGGSARPVLGGGEITAPIELYLAGRATSEVHGKTVPVAEIAIYAAQSWLRLHLPELDVAKSVSIYSRIRPGSYSLTELFLRGTSTPLANDTSVGVGFAPLTDLERVVLAVERRLNDPGTKRAHPELGSDMKVMGVRRYERIELTVACAIVARHVADLPAYLAARTVIEALALEAATTATRLDVTVRVNAEDVPERGEMFLTVSGTSAESGDDGEVGRGNRANGLITPYRPMTLEAAAGKNPVNHVGKLYNLAARDIAETVARELPGAEDATCVLVSRIGDPIDQPQALDLELGLSKALELRTLSSRAIEVVQSCLRDLPALQTRLLEGAIDVF